MNGADNYAGADGFTIKDTIAVDGSVTITYTYTVQDSDVEAGEIKNTAGVYLDDGDTPDPGDEPDGKDDVTVEMDDYTIDIEPADIVIYTGGEGYSGVVNADGNVVGDMVTGNGLPQPGYHLVLSPAVTEWINAKEGEDADAAAAAERLDQILTFTYDVGDVERTWKLDYLGIHSYNEDGSAAAYVYSMTEVNNNPVSLRVFEDKDNSKTLTDGDKTITTDDIPMSETAASAEYLMTIDGGPLDQSKVQGKFTIGEDSITCGVTIGYGTLTVKSTTNKEYVTEIGTVDDNQISATGEGVTYYVNNSEVEVASNRVGLLVDSVSNEPTFDQTMENHAISKVSGISDPRAQSFYLDLVDTDNGHAVVRPSGDVTIYWPMPEGADPDGKFYIVHYTEMDRTDTGMQTAEPEVEEVFATQDDNHLTFTTDSFSPFRAGVRGEGYRHHRSRTNPDPNPATMIPTKPDCTSIPEAARSSRTRSANSPSTTTPTTRSPLAPATASPAGMTAAASTTGMTRIEEIRVPLGSKTVFAGWEETTVPSMLNGDDHYAYIQGYADGSVRPNANITRAQVATIFFRLLDEDVRDDNLTTYNTFPDVNEDYWANTAISTMASLGVINGRNSGLFDPRRLHHPRRVRGHLRPVRRQRCGRHHHLHRHRGPLG